MDDLPIIIAWAGVGGAAGGILRFLVAGLVARLVGGTLPWGTIAVNATGCFVIGAIAAAADAGSAFLADPLWPLAVTGALGSYTTVSAFSLQTLTLARGGLWGRAAGNVLLSLGLCLCAVAAGFFGAAAVAGAAGS